MLIRRPTAPSARIPGPLGAVLGLPVGAATALGAWPFGGGPVVGLVLIIAAALWLGSATTAVGGVIAAVQMWGCYDGFVLHRLGTLHDGRADLLALGMAAGAALVAHAVTRAVIVASRHARAGVALRR
ncbi:MAG: hypothetical protein QOG20_6175 [Pseudonocardiales bacterium]|jgi:hypothetical protein|nr:hypothetical protein [Pseudonocardiales bacterium]